MSGDPLVADLLAAADALRAQGRSEGLAQAQQNYFGQSAIRLAAGLFAAALAQAAGQLRSVSPAAAKFFSAKAAEFEAFATPPTVTTVSPAKDAAGVALTDQVVVKFGVPMNPTTITPDSVYVAPSSGGPHLSGDLSFDAGSNVATFVPKNPLSAGVVYTITVTAAVESQAGQPLATDYTSTFTAKT